MVGFVEEKVKYIIYGGPTSHYFVHVEDTDSFIKKEKKKKKKKEERYPLYNYQVKSQDGPYTHQFIFGGKHIIV